MNIRPHVALTVTDIGRSVDFYRAFLGQDPVKREAGYAKFSLAEPALNLSLNLVERVAEGDGVSHFGIEVASSDAVATMRERIVEAGLGVRDERNVTCCFARQDKFWVRDPDGREWEVFTVLEDMPYHSDAAPARDCCAADCCA